VTTAARVALERGIKGSLVVGNYDVDPVTCIFSTLEDLHMVVVKAIESTGWTLEYCAIAFLIFD
jgi:hypothetical protein